MKETQPSSRHPLCAICDSTNQTTRLCAACRADPVNGGWSEGEPWELLEDVDAVTSDLSLGDLSGRRIRPDSSRKRAILRLVHGGTIRIAYTNRGPNRRNEPLVWRRRPLNLSEIAFLVGCSRQAVVKLLRKMIA